MKPVIWPFPLKGWSTENARSEQQPLTSPALLNVMPRDGRSGRMRGAQRGGLRKVDSGTALSGAVQAVLSVNMPLGGGGAYTSGTTISYAGQPDTTTLEALGWTTYYSSSGTNNFGATTASTASATMNRIMDGVMTHSSSSSYNPQDSYLGGQLTSGASHDVTAVLYTDKSDAFTTSYVAFGLRFADATSSHPSTGLRVYCNRARIQVLTQGGSVIDTYTLPTTYADAAMTVRVVLADAAGTTSITVYLDGAIVLSTSTATINCPNTNTGVGISTSYYAANGTGAGGRKGIHSLQIGAASTQTESTFERKLIVVAGGQVYHGPYPDELTAASGATVATTGRPGLAYLDSKVYIADGDGKPKVLDLNTGTVAAIAETAGTAPSDMTMAATWRGRLVLAGDPDNPQNFYMSKAGDGANWDYGDSTALAAVAGNAPTIAGHIGDPITALMPFRDDTLLVGTADGVFQFTGDPAAGGSIDNLTKGVGCIGPTAWTHTPDGRLLFVGPGGLYSVAGGAVGPSLALGRCDTFFERISADTQYVTLVWDETRHGLWIFVTPIDGSALVHLWWDARTDGFFPQKWDADFGPPAAAMYRGYGDEQAQCILGGHDGHLRSLFDDEKLEDTDVNGISPVYVVYEPITPAGEMEEAKLTRLDVIGGELASGDTDDDWTINVAVVTGDSIAEALDDVGFTDSSDLLASWPPADAQTITAPKRAATIRQRKRGSAFCLVVGNTTKGDYFSIDRIAAGFEPAGRVRA